MRPFALLLVLLAACNFTHPIADDQFARQALADLQTGRIEAARAHVDSVTTANGRPLTPVLAMIADSLRMFAPIDSSTKLVGWNVVNGVTYYAGLSYELSDKAGKRWGVATVDLRGRDSLKRVIGLGVSSLSEPLEELNRFTLRGKTPAHYLTLALAFLCVSCSVTAAVKVGRTPMPRRWLWTLLALVGAATFQLDWASGAWQFALIHFQLLSAGFTKHGPYAPWVISFSLPLGAAIALERRRRVLRTIAASEGPLEPSDD